MSAGPCPRPPDAGEAPARAASAARVTRLPAGAFGTFHAQGVLATLSPVAHPPLLRSLHGLSAEHAAARARGLPVEALRDQLGEARERSARAGRPPGPSRRRLLAGAAAAALPRPAGAWGARPVVAVVGGGLAGLACALGLADRGVESTVYEASGRAGGRIFSSRTYFAEGQTAEWCGEFIDRSHVTMRRLARRFGLPLDDLFAAQPLGSGDVLYAAGAYYPKQRADLDLAPIFDALAADAAPFPTLCALADLIGGRAARAPAR